MVTNLKNKRVLITAGPTWVPIDSVRIISNTATGETGILLAKKLSGLGARVTLLLGSAKKISLGKKVRVVAFGSFDELATQLRKSLKKQRYDILVHSAAVSDYRLKKCFLGRKLSSGLKELRLTLKPTPKLINFLRDRCKNSYLVGFKFEPGAGKNRLISEASRLIKKTGINLTVANSVRNGRYTAYLVTSRSNLGPMHTKSSLADNLIRLIRSDYAKFEHR